MNFTNHQIALTELPRIEEAEMQPLEPSYLTTQKITIGIWTVVVLILAAVFYFFVEEVKESPWFYGVLASLLFLLIFIYIGNLISFSKKGYAIREKDVMYRSGWLMQRIRIAPLNRVQHVSVQSGPIERKFKLASVSLYTAGSDDADFTIRGLKEENAQQIKEWIASQLYDNRPNS